MPKSRGTIERRYVPDLTRQVEALRRLIDNRAPAEACVQPKPPHVPASLPIAPPRPPRPKPEGGAP